MATWLKSTEIGMRIVFADVTIADAIDTSDFGACLLRGSLAIVPIAWSVASRLVSES